MKHPAFSRTKSIYSKLILSFIGIVVLLSFLLSSVLYLNFENTALNIIHQSNVKLLSEISYSASYMNDLSRNYCSSSFLSNDVIPLMFSDSEDMWTMGNTLRKLDTISIPSTYVHSMYFYNQSLDMYSSTFTTSFYSSRDFYDKEIVSILDNMDNEINLSLVPIPRKICTNTSNGLTYENVFTYLMYDISGNQVDGATIVNIKEDWLKNTIASLYSNTNDKDGSIFIIDNKGTIVSHSSSDMFIKNISSEKYIDKILSSGNLSGFFVEDINNTRYLVAYVTSGVLNWKFISLTPYQTITVAVQKVRLTSVLFCFLILLIGLIFALVLTKKIYTPIGSLVNSVRKQLPSKEKDNPNEINFLSSAFTEVIDRADSLENQKRNNLQTLKNDFLKNLLTGNFTLPQEGIESKLKELNITLSIQERLLLFIFKIDNYKNFTEAYSEKDRALYKFAIANVANEFIGRHFKNEAVDMGNDHICMLLNMDNSSSIIDNGLNRTIREDIAEIQACIRDYFDLSLSASVGYITENLYKAGTSYTEGLNISLYRIKYGHGSIIFTENLNEVNDNNYTFPVAKEKLLLDSIKMANWGQSRELFDEIINGLSVASYENIVSSLLYLTLSIYNCINSIEKNSSYRFPIDFSTLIRQITNLETLDQARSMFVDLLGEVSGSINENKGKKSDKIVNNVIGIIQSNYHDKNLCLNSIASSIKMSPIYLGKIFKDATTKSVAEYITELRLEKVKHFIDTTNMPVTDILEKTGFEKTSYFYTTFKKYFGVSLSEYKLAKHV